QGVVRPAAPGLRLRGLLAGGLRRRSRVRRLQGLGPAVVLRPGFRRHAAGRAAGRPVPPGVLPARRRPGLRNLLDDPPRRGGNGLQLRADGPHRVRAPGTVGGLAPRLATTVATRRGRRYPGVRGSGQCPRAALLGRITPHRPVVPARSRAFRRPREQLMVAAGPGRRPTALAGAGSAATVTALAATLGLAAVCWVVSVWQMTGMNMGTATPLGSFGFFIAVWAAMMAAMMLPGAAPAVARRAQAGGVRAVPLFVVSYLAVWALVGVLVYVVDRPH